MEKTNKNQSSRINFIVKKLGIAIKNGDFKSANVLSNELCLHSLLLTQLPDDQDNQIISVEVYSLQKKMRKIKLNVSPSISLRELKELMRDEYHFPVESQNWFIQDHFAYDDSQTLQSYGFECDNTIAELFLFNSPTSFLTYEERQLQVTLVDDSSKQKLYLNLLTLYDKPGAILNEESFECGSCLGKTLEGKGIVLRNCLHSFCRDCLVKIIETTEQAEVKCPSCDECLQHQEIKHILKDEEAWNKFLNKSEIIFKNLENPSKQELYSNLLTLYDQSGAILNKEAFECGICFETIPEEKGIVLRSCIHLFCRDCLIKTIQTTEQAEVKCPSCDECLEHQEIKHILTDEEDWNRFLNKSKKFAINSAGKEALICLTPDCENAFFINDKITRVKCCLCQNTSCILCKKQHTSDVCPTDSDEKDKLTSSYLAEQLDKKLMMICPNCGSYVEKEIGCDFLTCSSCKVGLCWATKKLRYGKDGCQCKPFKRCSPNCNNCH